MVWFITGSQNDLRLGVSASGALICEGFGKHECKPHFEDKGHTLLKTIQDAECVWQIIASTESELNIDGNGYGLFQRVQSSPDTPQGMITFLNPRSVMFTFVVPEVTFYNIRHLLELVLLSAPLRYAFTVGFGGFRVPHAQTATPTWQEFIDGKPYFFNEMSLAVNSPENHA